MTVELFITLLTFFSIATSLIVEAIKSVLEDKYTIPCNLFAWIVATIVGTAGTLLVYYFTGIGFSGQNIVCAVLMGFASGIGSMVGYDKVIQLINQCRL